jgi:polyhydroxybutyrate depolymerase
MVIHSSGDTLFSVAEGFGYQAAQFWAACNACAADPVDDGTCLRWSDCADGVPTLYCETSGQHGQWTGLNAEMFAFFDAAGG